MLSAYLTEEATLLLLLFLSKYLKYNYDQKSITENAFVIFSRWTIFCPASKICSFKQTSGQHTRKNRQKSRYNLVKFAMGVYRNDYQKRYFVHLSFPYLYFCLCFYCFCFCSPSFSVQQNFMIR